ncbi:MAG: EamA family transporter [Desulfobacteraceae bacterium]|nr:EamA family transporter [Desulfobacteraceae bacterium]
MRASATVPARGYAFVVLAAMFWAVSGTSGKYLFQHGMTPVELVQLRVTITSALLFCWLYARDRSLLRISSRDILYFMVLGVAGTAMLQFLYFYSISKIQVAMAILLEYLAPVFIALYSVLFVRERLTTKTTVAIAGTTAGCYLAVGAYNVDLLGMNWVGIVSGIASAIAFAWYTVHGERGMRRYDPATVLFYGFLFAAFFWNAVVPPFQALRHGYSPVEWGLIFYIVVFGTMVPFGLYTHGINLIRSTRASVTATLEPILAGFISYIFLGESLALPQMAGGFLVIGSVVLLQIGKERDENTPALIRTRNRGETSER